MTQPALFSSDPASPGSRATGGTLANTPLSTTALVRICDWSDLAGKTIRHVEPSPAGESSSCDCVLVFDENSWAALRVDTNDEDAHLTICNWYTPSDVTLALSPDQLYAAGLINDGQRELLAQQADQRKREMATREAERIRRRLVELAPLLAPAEPKA